jgi:hypothetical protein
MSKRAHIVNGKHLGYLDFQLMLVSRNLGYLGCPLKVSFYELYKLCTNPEISIEDALEGGRVHLQNTGRTD